jgi:peptidoglycan/LPS O-acetylase OafA/YrhL
VLNQKLSLQQMNFILYFSIVFITILIAILLYTLVENIRIKRKLEDFRIRHEMRLNQKKQQMENGPERA